MPNIYEAKARLSKLIHQVEKTRKAVTISRNGVPVADLVPHLSITNPLEQDKDLVGARYHCDPTLGVDERDWPIEQR